MSITSVLEKYRVDVHKLQPDNRLNLYGQPLKSEGKYGHGYFTVPAEFKIKENMDFYAGYYEFGDEYLPEANPEVQPEKNPTDELPWLPCEYPGCSFQTKFSMALVGHQRSHPDMAKYKKDALKGFEKKRGPKPKVKEEAEATIA